MLGFRDGWKKNEVSVCIEANITEYEHPKSAVNFYFGSVKRGYAWFFDKGDHASIGIFAVNEEASDLKQLFESFIKNCKYINTPGNSEMRVRMNAWRIPANGGIPGNFAKGNGLLTGDAAGLVGAPWPEAGPLQPL